MWGRLFGWARRPSASQQTEVCACDALSLEAVKIIYIVY